MRLYLSLVLYVASLIALALLVDHVTGMEIFQTCYLGNPTWMLAIDAATPIESSGGNFLEKRNTCCGYLKNLNALKGVTEYFTQSNNAMRQSSSPLGLFFPLACLNSLETEATDEGIPPCLPIFTSLSREDSMALLKSNPILCLLLTSYPSMNHQRAKNIVPFILNQPQVASLFRLFFKENPSCIENTPANTWMALWNTMAFRSIVLPNETQIDGHVMNLSHLFVQSLSIDDFIKLPKEFRDKIVKPYFAVHLEETDELAGKLKVIMEREAIKKEITENESKESKKLKESKEEPKEEEKKKLLDNVADISKKADLPLADRLDNLFRITPKKSDTDANSDKETEKNLKIQPVSEKKPDGEVPIEVVKLSDPILVTSTINAPPAIVTTSIIFLNDILQRNEILNLMMPTLLTKTVQPAPTNLNYYSNNFGNVENGASYFGISKNDGNNGNLMAEIRQDPEGNPKVNTYPLGLNLDFLKFDNIKAHFKNQGNDINEEGGSKKDLKLKGDGGTEGPVDRQARIQVTQVNLATQIATTLSPATFTLISAFSQQVIHVTAPPILRNSNQKDNQMRQHIPISTEERIKTVTIIHEQLPQKEITHEDFQMEGKGMPGGESFEWAEGKAKFEQSKVRELFLKRISNNQFLLVESDSISTFTTCWFFKTLAFLLLTVTC